MNDTSRVRTCLWFDRKALPAAEFYCSLLADSRIDRVERYPDGLEMGEPGAVLSVDFTLAGTPYLAINGGPRVMLDEAVSILVATKDQAETDRLWEALIADGGVESQCGWLTDRFGLSWQIVPERALELMRGSEAAAVWKVLQPMRRIDIAALEAAAARA